MQAELFPFLAVLACMIGTLVLVIIIVTSGVLGEKRSITLVARDTDARSTSIRPHIVELRRDGVMLHSSKQLIPASELRKAGTPLRQLLQEVARNRDEEYIIVAIRPDGYAHFERLRDMIEGRGIKIGYEPVDQEWKIHSRGSS